MQRPPFLNSKLMFQDFPKEFIIKTYLGSRVLVILRWESKLVIWKEDNIFIRLSEIDLQASKDEIQDKHNKVCEFCEDFNKKNKPKKAKKSKETGVSIEDAPEILHATLGTLDWPTFYTDHLSVPPPQFSQETLDNIAENMPGAARNERRYIEHDFNE